MIPEVLIVGNPTRRSGLLQQVQSLGYQADLCQPHELYRRVRTGPPPASIIVCAADTDPSVLMATLRRSRQGSALPVVLYGRLGGDVRDLADVLDLGADHFIEQSADDEQVASALEELAGPPTAAPDGAASVASPPREPAEASTAPGGERGGDPMLGQLHRTLDLLEARLRARDGVESSPSRLTVPEEEQELAALGLDAVPDVEGDDALFDPGDSGSRLRLTMRGEGRGSPPAPDRTVRLDDEPAPPPWAPARAREEDSGTSTRAGPLPPGGVPELLIRLHRSGFTGACLLVQGRVEKRAYLVDGEIKFARSNISRDRLVDRLHERGLLDEPQFEYQRRLAAREPRRAGELLVEAGVLKPVELHAAVREHLQRIVDSTFSWVEGRFALFPEELGAENIELDLSLPRLVLEGLRHRLSPAEAWSRLGERNASVRLRARPEARGRSEAPFEDLGLSPAEIRWLQGLDGRRDLATVVAEGPGAEGDLLALLVLTRLTGAIELLPQPVPEPKVARDPLEIDRGRILARLRLVREADYFAVLGVPRDASAGEVRRAYLDLSRTFADGGLETETRRSLAREIEELRHGLADAHEILSDDALRSVYLAHLHDP